MLRCAIALPVPAETGGLTSVQDSDPRIDADLPRELPANQNN